MREKVNIKKVTPTSLKANINVGVACNRKPKAELLPVDECIREGILADFLSRNRLEAVMFSMYEHNEEEEKRKYRKAEREYGIEIGKELGRSEGIELGRSEGIELGKRIGMEEGKRSVQEDLMHNLMKNMNLTEEEAKKWLGI